MGKNSKDRVLHTLADGKEKLRLRDVDPDETGGLDKKLAMAQLAVLGEELSDLLDLLYYAGQHGLLVVLQGRDTGGKDGTIRMLLDHSNAQSCRVVPFKAPTPVERAHDFLWRVHRHVPGRGEIVLFNRSHYEDVLAARVHQLVPERIWHRRFDAINAFERLLVGEGTILFKFFLNISKKEQRKRLLEREEDREKAWKLSVGDWKERELWDATTEAYEDVLNRCASRRRPWHVIAANQKWFRNLAVAEALVKGLRPYRKEWLASLSQVGDRALAEIRAYRKKNRA